MAGSLPETVGKVKQAKMKIPTLEQIQDYANATSSKVSPVKFYHYYNGRNWIGRNGHPIKDWIALFDSWGKFERGQVGGVAIPIKPINPARKATPIEWVKQPRDDDTQSSEWVAIEYIPKAERSHNGFSIRRI